MEDVFHLCMTRYIERQGCTDEGAVLAVLFDAQAWAAALDTPAERRKA